MAVAGSEEAEMQNWGVPLCPKELLVLLTLFFQKYFLKCSPREDSISLKGFKMAA